MSQREIILSKMPPALRGALSGVPFDGLEEIRLRLGRGVFLHGSFGARRLDYRPTERDFAAVLSALCDRSVYARAEELKRGYLTIEGGCRVGLAGRAVFENGEVSRLTDISAFNFRVAREIFGAAAEMTPHILQGGRPRHTLLLSPPGCGKTTALRDICRCLSASYKVCVVDERSEIAGSFRGVPQFDLGPNADVLDGVPKAVGIAMAVRALSPQVLVTDEIGTAADLDAIRGAAKSGVKIIASLHSDGGATPEILSLFELALVMARHKLAEARRL
jgi:stage III sporulation protein AA